jgi:hypothetical protein
MPSDALDQAEIEWIEDQSPEIAADCVLMPFDTMRLELTAREKTKSCETASHYCSQ